MSAQTTTPDVASTERWARMLWVAIPLVALANIVVMVLAGEVIPPLLVFDVLFVAGLVLLAMRPRLGVRVLGILSALFVLTSLPFAVPELSHPDSFASFATSMVQV